jgi:hypothetical protein
MDSTMQIAPRDTEIINEIAPTGDAWIGQRKEPLWTEKSSTKIESLLTQQSSTKLLPLMTQGFNSANSPYGLRND